jgi:hypothetical protein
MSRTVAIYENPIMEPGVCARCASQDKDWFVDLGLIITGERTNPNNVREPVGSDYTYPNLWFEGAIFYCCDCINNLVTDVSRKLEEFKNNHIVKVEFNGPRIDNPSSDGRDKESDGDNKNSNGTSPFKLSGLEFSSTSI